LSILHKYCVTNTVPSSLLQTLQHYQPNTPPQHREMCEKAATSYGLLALENDYEVTSWKPQY